MITEINNLEEMCDLMCDNKLPERAEPQEGVSDYLKGNISEKPTGSNTDQHTQRVEIVEKIWRNDAVALAVSYAQEAESKEAQDILMDLRKDLWNIPSAEPCYMGCHGCVHYDQQQTALICHDCKRYYGDMYEDGDKHE